MNTSSECRRSDALRERRSTYHVGQDELDQHDRVLHTSATRDTRRDNVIGKAARLYLGNHKHPDFAGQVVVRGVLYQPAKRAINAEVAQKFEAQ